MSAKKPKFKQHTSNYNYKPKRSFGQRIKNFFSIPEEDLKEEESPKFERVKLFGLNRIRLFTFLALFAIIVNILIIFDLNIIYLRQILGFLFIVLVPGLLIMLCFKIRSVGFWEYLVYTVGLSVAFIMFAGLLVNWTLPLLNITDKPLSLWPILICFDIFFLGLWLTAIYRNRDLKPFDITIPKLDAINRIFFIIPMIFPLLSILGAFLLNNHGPNILTMIMLGGIAVYILFLGIFRKHMNENVWPFSLYLMGLSLVLMGSIRSWFLAASDASLEIYFAKEILTNSIWGLGNLNGYNAMLSITIFPAVSSIISKINLYFIIKLLFPVVFSFLTIIIYLIFNKHFNKIVSFFGVLFFIFQPTITGWQLLPPRQEISYLFLSLILLILFHNKINFRKKKILFVVFGASMIVSHYSTSYVALAVFILTYILTLIYKIYEDNKIKKGKIDLSQRYIFYLKGALVLVLLIFGFLWYNQITTTSDGAISFTKNSFENFNKVISEEGIYIFDPLNLFNKNIDYNPKRDLLEYSEKFTNENSSHNYKPLNYPLSIKPTSSLPYTDNSFYISGFFENIKRVILILGILFMSIGILFIFFSKKLNIDILFKIFIIAYAILFIIVLIMTSLSSGYNIDRLYQQQLILLSICSIIGFSFIFQRLNKNINLILFSIFLIIYLLIFTHVQYYFIGGREVQLRFANIGKSYDLDYTSFYEIYSTNWLFINKMPNTPIVSDNYGRFKMYQTEKFSFNANIKMDVLPILILDNDYVYSSRTNTLEKITFKYYNSGLIIYNFPTDFLNENKNLLYSNGGSEIFR